MTALKETIHSKIEIIEILKDDIKSLINAEDTAKLINTEVENVSYKMNVMTKNIGKMVIDAIRPFETLEPFKMKNNA